MLTPVPSSVPAHHWPSTGPSPPPLGPLLISTPGAHFRQQEVRKQNKTKLSVSPSAKKRGVILPVFRRLESTCSAPGTKRTTTEQLLPLCLWASDPKDRVCGSEKLSLVIWGGWGEKGPSSWTQPFSILLRAQGGQYNAHFTDEAQRSKETCPQTRSQTDWCPPTLHRGKSIDGLALWVCRCVDSQCLNIGTLISNCASALYGLDPSTSEPGGAWVSCPLGTTEVSVLP